MYFEGPEKKVEIGLDEAGPNLRRLDQAYWHARVAEAGAVILSSLKNAELDAYLLSESSLFVYPRRVVMITCGRTTLASATETMLTDWQDHVAYMIYERKNEHFPEYQPTDFADDARRLAKKRPATAVRFGTPDSHRIQILATEQPNRLDPEERTLEVLMHGIHPEAAAMFGRDRGGRSPDRRAQLNALFDGFEVDEHYFEPTGYSLNAIRGTDYMTIHVTPEEIASYVSFETNIPFGDSAKPWVDRVRAVFEPRALDVMTFAPHRLEPIELERHHLVGWTEDVLAIGYHVTFRHFERFRARPEPAFSLPLQPRST